MTYSTRSLFVFCFVLLVALGAGALPGAAQATDYLVTFQPGTPQAARAAAAGRHGAVLRYNYRIIDSIAIKVPNQSVLQALSQDASVLRITPDYPVFASQAPQASDHANANAKPEGKPGGGGGGSTPTGEVYPEGVKRVLTPAGATTAPEPNNDAGLGIGVAIVDTGIDYNHADLKRLDASGTLIPVVVAAYNAFDENGTCLDDNGHGTHVAGTVAAQNNDRDVIGVAPGVDLYCVKVLNAQGSGSWATIIKGLDWIDEFHASHVQVVNMSLGGGGTDVQSDLRDAIERIRDKGIVVVVAAGNDENTDVKDQVPAAYIDHVLTIASSAATAGNANKCSVKIPADTASYFTSSGAGVTISAPGEDREDTKPGCLVSSVGILSLKRGGGTTRMSGTSMSSPHVAGIVARILKSPTTFGLQSTWTLPKDILPDVKRYLTDPARGADRQGSAPIPFPSSSVTNDGMKEGISILR